MQTLSCVPKFILFLGISCSLACKIHYVYQILANFVYLLFGSGQLAYNKFIKGFPLKKTAACCCCWKQGWSNQIQSISDHTTALLPSTLKKKTCCTWPKTLAFFPQITIIYSEAACYSATLLSKHRESEEAHKKPVKAKLQDLLSHQNFQQQHFMCPETLLCFPNFPKHWNGTAVVPPMHRDFDCISKEWPYQKHNRHLSHYLYWNVNVILCKKDDITQTSSVHLS